MRTDQIFPRFQRVDATALIACIIVLFSLGVAAIRQADEQDNRSYCSANLCGIEKSMILYSADNNDIYPVVLYAPYTKECTYPRGSVTAKSQADAIAGYYREPQGEQDEKSQSATRAAQQAGSPTACLWLLVLNGNLSTKQFICPSDPTKPKPATTATAHNNGLYYNNFGIFQNKPSDQTFSYSFAYPWSEKKQPGNWWMNTVDSSLPIGCDMAPLDGSGDPPRNVKFETTKEGLFAHEAGTKFRRALCNSQNHDGEGQNVVFGDTHVEWSPTPRVGQEQDNIFTVQVKNGEGKTVEEAPTEANVTAPEERKIGECDIVMVPVRPVLKADASQPATATSHSEN